MGRLKLIKICLGVFMLLLMTSFTHEYYVSIANIYVNDTTNQFEIELKIDAEDLEKVLTLESGNQVNLERIDKKTLNILQYYLAHHFKVYVNGAAKNITIVGDEFNPDGSFWCYITVDLPTIIQTVKIKNDILLPTFLKQHNIVNLKIKEQTYSHTYIHNHTLHTFKVNDN